MFLKFFPLLVILLGISSSAACVKAEKLALVPRGAGVYGSPEIFWEQGYSLEELGITAVVMGHPGATPELIQRCHKEGAKFFLDFGIYVGAKIAEEHPELWPVGADSEKLQKQEWYLGLCPTYDWYNEQKLEEMREALSELDIDGLWLDFIRWPCHWEVLEPRLEQSCFCDNAVNKFAAALGTELPGSTIVGRANFILENYCQEWSQWKAEQITEFVRRAREVVQEVRPAASLGVFSVPWGPQDYDNAILEVIGQDFKSLAEYVDIFSPMVYHAMCGREVGWVGEYTSYLAEETGRAIWPIVQALDAPEKISGTELRRVLHEALSSGASGVLVFTAQEVAKNKAKLKAMKKSFVRFKEASG